MAKDYVADVSSELDAIETLPDFCKDWSTKWRGIAIGAQGVLQASFPAAAKVLGLLIKMADTVCVLPPTGDTLQGNITIRDIVEGGSATKGGGD
jgi:hypothetical protein